MAQLEQITVSLPEGEKGKAVSELREHNPPSRGQSPSPPGSPQEIEETKGVRRETHTEEHRETGNTEKQNGRDQQTGGTQTDWETDR